MIIGKLKPCIALLILLCLDVAFADLEKIKKNTKSKIDAIDVILTRLELQLSKAEEQNEMRQVNCILTKVNLVKGLLKSSQRASLILTRAYIDNQSKISQTYQKRIEDYHASAVELEASLDECIPRRRSSLAAFLVFISPLGAGAFDFFKDISPWSNSYIEDAENLPVIPPASPFR